MYSNYILGFRYYFIFFWPRFLHLENGMIKKMVLNCLSLRCDILALDPLECKSIAHLEHSVPKSRLLLSG